jgi:hypothetical protein
MALCMWYSFLPKITTSSTLEIHRVWTFKVVHIISTSTCTKSHKYDIAFTFYDFDSVLSLHPRQYFFIADKVIIMMGLTLAKLANDFYTCGPCGSEGIVFLMFVPIFTIYDICD